MTRGHRSPLSLGAPGFSRAYARTRPRAKRTTFAPRGNRANLRTQEKREIIYKRKKYILCVIVHLFSLLPAIPYVRITFATDLRTANTRTAGGTVPPPTRPGNPRICERLRTQCERFVRTRGTPTLTTPNRSPALGFDIIRDMQENRSSVPTASQPSATPSGALP